jgi:hypothetical protein
MEFFKILNWLKGFFLKLMNLLKYIFSFLLNIFKKMKNNKYVKLSIELMALYLKLTLFITALINLNIISENWLNIDFINYKLCTIILSIFHIFRSPEEDIYNGNSNIQTTCGGASDSIFTKSYKYATRANTILGTFALFGASIAGLETLVYQSFTGTDSLGIKHNGSLVRVFAKSMFGEEMVGTLTENINPCTNIKNHIIEEEKIITEKGTTKAILNIHASGVEVQVHVNANVAKVIKEKGIDIKLMLEEKSKE